ncbi:MAG: radical SAM protein [Oligoflexia bacterium]|nr:radical SAM protein [Oligoflexia bacterium]
MLDYCGRRIHKLRISITNKCNLNCFYCKPSSISTKANTNMSSDEFVDIITVLVDSADIDEIRITGGEPSISPHLEPITNAIGKFNSIKKFAITSNGLTLLKYLPMLKENNCTNINLSIDSLIPHKFHKITGGGDLKQVLKLIDQGQKLGFKIKINIVVMKDINDDELVDFVIFSAQKGIEVRFLELIRMGGVLENFDRYYFPFNFNNLWSHLNLLINKQPNRKINFSITKKTEDAIDSTSSNFMIKINNLSNNNLSNNNSSIANIGIISSTSTPFCHSCSRLRLDSEGNLRACLMSNEDEVVNLRNIKHTDYMNIIKKITLSKPTLRSIKSSNYMSDIGG